MSVIVQKYPAKIKGLQGTILMWSCCRKCGQETQVIPMSENTWKYSFAKYLELTFWSSELHPRAGICPHDIHKDHVRYFGFHNLAVRIQYDHVPLYEIIVPRPVITWKVDGDLKLKNEQYLRIEERLDRFMTSVRTRLKCIHVDSVIPEKVEVCRVEVERLLRRANEEHEWLREKLQDKYMSSRYYEIIPLNRAIRAIQEKAIAWDDTFGEFEQQFFLSFRPLDEENQAIAELQSLTQKKCRTLDDYIQKFQSAYMRSGLTDDRGLIQMFIRGLDSDIVTAIIARENPPITLGNWYTEAAKTYNWQRQYAMESLLSHAQHDGLVQGIYVAVLYAFQPRAESCYEPMTHWKEAPARVRRDW